MGAGGVCALMVETGAKRGGVVRAAIMGRTRGRILLAVVISMPLADRLLVLWERRRRAAPEWCVGCWKGGRGSLKKQIRKLVEVLWPLGDTDAGK